MGGGKDNSSNSTSTSNTKASATETTYKVNDKVSIEEKGKWYPGYIMEVKGDEYKIHYDGYDSKYDIFVTTARLKPLAGTNTVASNTTATTAAAGTYKNGDMVEYLYRDTWVEAEIVSELSSAGRYQVKFNGSMYEYAYPKELKATNKTNAIDAANEASKKRMESYGYIYKAGEQVWIKPRNNSSYNSVVTIISSENLASKEVYDAKTDQGTIQIKHESIISKYDASATDYNKKMSSPANSFPIPKGGEVIDYLDANYAVCDLTKAKMCRIYKPKGANKTENDDIAYYFLNGQLQSKCKCSYIDNIKDQNTKLYGIVLSYKENGEEDYMNLFSEKGERLYYDQASRVKGGKYQIGQDIQILTFTGDQNIWVPGKVLWFSGGDAYVVSTPEYEQGAGLAKEIKTYESSLRAANSPITYKYGLGLVAAPAEPHIQDLAKKELMQLRPGATIIKNEMNTKAWEITVDIFKIPEYRTKNGRMLYKMPNGELRSIDYNYGEKYITGSGYQKGTKVGLISEHPVSSY